MEDGPGHSVYTVIRRPLEVIKAPWGLDVDLEKGSSGQRSRPIQEYGRYQAGGYGSADGHEF